MHAPINPTPTEFVALRRSFRRRQNAAWAAFGIWVGGFGLVLALGLPAWWIGVAWAVAAVLSLSAWRCPRCGELLGRSLFVRECSHCYLRLSEDMSTGSR
jgi:hypothetical protein